LLGSEEIRLAPNSIVSNIQIGISYLECGSSAAAFPSNQQGSNFANVQQFELKVPPQFAKCRNNDKLSRARHHRFMFELPGVLVRNVDSVESNL
jgi:hypothetical protein